MVILPEDMVEDVGNLDELWYCLGIFYDMTVSCCPPATIVSYIFQATPVQCC